MSTPTVSANSLKWATASYGLRQAAVTVIAIGSSFMLTRALAPQDFGMVAVATMVFSLGLLVADGGLGLYLIQRQREVTHRDLSEILSLQWLVALAIIALLGGVVGVERMLTGGHPALWLSWVACLSLPFSALRGITLLPFERSVQMGKIALVDVIEQLVLAGSSILLAMAGFGPWSIVLAMLLRAIVGAGISFALAPWPYRPALPAMTPEFWSGLTFALHYQGAQLVNIVRTSVNPLYINSLFGLKSVGYVDRATYVNSAPLSLITSIQSRVFFPFSARIQDDRARLGRFLEDSIFISSALDKLVYLPLFLFIDPIISLAFTDAWLPMAPLARWFILGTMAFAALTSPLYPVINGLGAARFLFKFGVASAVVSWIVTVPLAWRFGIEGVGMASCVLWLGVFWLRAELVRHIGNFAYWRQAASPIAAAGASGLIIEGLLHVLGQAPHTVWTVLGWSCLSVVLYVGALCLFAWRRVTVIATKIRRW